MYIYFQYWVDYKAKLKRRSAAVRASLTRTGGGPAGEPALTDLEMKFLAILGQDYGAGIPNVQVDPFPEVSFNLSTSLSNSNVAFKNSQLYWNMLKVTCTNKGQSHISKFLSMGMALEFN